MTVSFFPLAASLPFFEKTLTYSNAELESRLANLAKSVPGLVRVTSLCGAERMARLPGNERSGWGEVMDGEGLLEPKDLDGDGVCVTYEVSLK